MKTGDAMSRTTLVGLLIALSASWVLAQETKPVPKDSLRISIPGCAKNAVFTTGKRTVDEPGTLDVAEGVHMHMNGSKKVMADIKAHQATMIEITGIVRRSDLDPGGISLGKGVTIKPGPAPSGSTMGGVPLASQIQIDVESWRQIPGECPR